MSITQDLFFCERVDQKISPRLNFNFFWNPNRDFPLERGDTKVENEIIQNEFTHPPPHLSRIDTSSDHYIVSGGGLKQQASCEYSVKVIESTIHIVNCHRVYLSFVTHDS